MKSFINNVLLLLISYFPFFTGGRQYKMGSGDLSCGGSCMKYLLFIFNVVFFVSTLGLFQKLSSGSRKFFFWGGASPPSGQTT